ncbi:hypothetical protein Asi03nite_17800 [Actinoplanes siamensis]|uniref:Uncharacterized protein n=1 Tax=Actinoplanes siamensis TaxID=1223317 RepID=A0A919N4Q6_9ACTN|nr:hypothetical protein Asi03nite_17800 [Actinoplanes siamensis]
MRAYELLPTTGKTYFKGFLPLADGEALSEAAGGAEDGAGAEDTAWREGAGVAAAEEPELTKYGSSPVPPQAVSAAVMATKPTKATILRIVPSSPTGRTPRLAVPAAH